MRRSWPRVACVTVGAVLAASCATSSASPPLSSPGPSLYQSPVAEQTVSVVGERSAVLPASCQPTAVATMLMRFARAINTGDKSAIETYFAPDFNRFSIEPKGIISFSATEVASFLSDRRSHNETWRFVAVNVTGPDWRGGADLEYSLARAADDIPQSEIARGVEGKAAIDCGTPLIVAWAMSPPIGNPCPMVGLNRDPTVVVACVRVGAAAAASAS